MFTEDLLCASYYTRPQTAPALKEPSVRWLFQKFKLLPKSYKNRFRDPGHVVPHEAKVNSNSSSNDRLLACAPYWSALS